MLGERLKDSEGKLRLLAPDRHISSVVTGEENSTGHREYKVNINLSFRRFDINHHSYIASYLIAHLETDLLTLYM